MKTRYMWPAILLIMLIALVLNSQISLSQEKQKPVKDQAKMSKDEIPITTTSQDARQKYIEGLGYLENIQIEKAKSSFQEAVKADPNFALGYFGLAQTGSGFTAIKENYDKAEKNMKNISEGEKHLISFAKSQFEGNTSQAQKEIQQLTNMFPKDKRVHFYAAQLEFNTNRDYDAVIKSLRKAIDIDKNYAPAYNLMGYAYSFKNDFNKAENAFKKYISLAPDNPNPYDSYAELLLKNGRYDESIKQYQKALKIDPTFMSSIEGIGNNYLFKNDFAKARENYQALYDKAPSANWKINSLYDQAVSFVREGDITNALSTLEKRVSLGESEGLIPSVINSHRMQGFILAENGKADEAMKHYDMAKEKLEGSSLPEGIKNNLTNQIKLDRLYGMVALGQIDNASSEMKSKEQVIGSSGNAQDEKDYELISGILAYKQNKFDEALSHFSKSDDQSPLNWYYMAMAYQKKGDDQKSNQMLDKIRKSNQNSLELAVANNHAKETVAQTK